MALRTPGHRGLAPPRHRWGVGDVEHLEARLSRGSATVVRRGAPDRLTASLLGVGVVGAPARWGDQVLWGETGSDPAGADAERDRIRAIVAEVHRKRAARRARRTSRRTM